MEKNKTYITFRLDNEHDRELIRWLNEQPNRSDAIRRSLAETMTVQEKQFAKILDILEELRLRPIGITSNGSAEQVTEKIEKTEPQDIANSLDDLWR